MYLERKYNGFPVQFAEDWYSFYGIIKVLKLEKVKDPISRYVKPEHIKRCNGRGGLTEGGVWDLFYAPCTKNSVREGTYDWLKDLVESNKVRFMPADNSLHIFYNEQFGELTMIQLDGKPWFIAKEVAEKLGYSNTRDAIIKHVDEWDRTYRNIDRFGYVRNMVLISESGLYSLIMNSRMPNAPEFRTWVQCVIISSIRKENESNDRQSEAIARIMDSYEKLIEETKRLKEIVSSHELVKKVEEKV